MNIDISLSYLLPSGTMKHKLIDPGVLNWYTGLYRQFCTRGVLNWYSPAARKFSSLTTVGS